MRVRTLVMMAAVALGLMTRLMLDHAQAAATLIKAEGGHDR